MTAAASKKKGKRKADEVSEDESDDDTELVLDATAMDIDDTSNTVNSRADSIEYKPMEASGDIASLRAKLRARVEELRRKKGPKKAADGDVGSRDDLLEERRQQRALMRERRRKETREKKKREEEERAKRGKGRAKQTSGTVQKVRTPLLMLSAGSQYFT